MKNKINKIRDEMVNHFNSTDSCHDLDHTVRVCNLAIHIWKIENADLEIIEVAALLHDISRHEQDKVKWKACHAELWAIKAKKFLEERWFDRIFIDKIEHAIACHRFRWKNIPESLEAKIIFDADKLDWMWAIGIWRLFMFAWENHAKLHDKNPNLTPWVEYTKDDTAYREFMLKAPTILDRFFTDEAKKIAKDRFDFMNLFFDRMNREVDWEI